MIAPKCPICQAELAVAEGATGLQQLTCGNCRGGFEIEVFPAQWRRVQQGRPGERVTGDEAACFIHTDRRAEAACDSCGRFMCALCEVRVGVQRLCVACLESGRRSKRLAQVERSRTIFPLLASRIALFGLFLGPLAPAAGLSAIVLACFGFTRPPGLTGRRYVGAGLWAVVLGTAITLGWAWWWLSTVTGSAVEVLPSHE